MCDTCACFLLYSNRSLLSELCLISDYRMSVMSTTFIFYIIIIIRISTLLPSKSNLIVSWYWQTWTSYFTCFSLHDTASYLRRTLSGDGLRISFTCFYLALLS